MKDTEMRVTVRYSTHRGGQAKLPTTIERQIGDGLSVLPTLPVELAPKSRAIAQKGWHIWG